MAATSPDKPRTAQEAWGEVTGNRGVPLELWFLRFWEGQQYPEWMIGGQGVQHDSDIAG